jgi:ubiquinone/menaquinone biosynthesis C-methylase UbiE
MLNQVEFDKFADQYHQQHLKNIAITGEDPAYFSEYKIRELRRIINLRQVSSKSIFDFGCGIGNSIEWFRKYFGMSEITCGDVSLRSLEICQSRFPDHENYLHIKGEQIPCNDATFDVVFSSCVFHHIPHEDHSLWLNELWRVTRPGGLLVIHDYLADDPLNAFHAAFRLTLLYETGTRTYRDEEYRGWLRESGFSSVSRIDLNPLEKGSLLLAWR